MEAKPSSAMFSHFLFLVTAQNEFIDLWPTCVIKFSIFTIVVRAARVGVEEETESFRLPSIDENKILFSPRSWNVKKRLRL